MEVTDLLFNSRTPEEEEEEKLGIRQRGYARKNLWILSSEI